MDQIDLESRSHFAVDRSDTANWSFGIWCWREIFFAKYTDIGDIDTAYLPVGLPVARPASQRCIFNVPYQIIYEKKR